MSSHLLVRAKEIIPNCISSKCGASFSVAGVAVQLSPWLSGPFLSFVVPAKAVWAGQLSAASLPAPKLRPGKKLLQFLLPIAM